jgi:hypothetical protein
LTFEGYIFGFLGFWVLKWAYFWVLWIVLVASYSVRFRGLDLDVWSRSVFECIYNLVASQTFYGFLIFKHEIYVCLNCKDSSGSGNCTFYVMFLFWRGWSSVNKYSQVMIKKSKNVKTFILAPSDVIVLF